MSSFAKTGLFASLVMIAVLYGVYDYQKMTKEKIQERASEFIYKGWDLNEIESLTVFNKGKRIYVERDEMGWMIKEPVVDRADRTQMALAVDGLLKEKITPVNAESKNPGFFGLDFKKNHITLSKKNGESITVTVGDKLAFSKERYLQRDSTVFVGAASWAGYVNPHLNQMRSRFIFPFLSESMEVVGFDVKAKGQNYKYIKKDEGWSLKGKALTGEELKKINGFLDAIGNLKAANIVADEADKKHRALFGLDQLSLQLKMNLVVGTKENHSLKSWSLAVGSPHNGYIFAVGSDRNIIYRLTEDKSKELQDLIL